MNDLLFGQHPEEHIVAVQHLDDSTMRVYIRDGDAVRTRDERFFPFFYLSDATYLEGFKPRHWVKRLEGALFYQDLCVFESWPAMWDGVRHVLDARNRDALTKAEHYSELDVLHLVTDPVMQFLMQTGRTLFKGMTFEQVHRLQLDIETYTAPPHRYSNAQRPADRIILIALSDNRGWTHVIDGKKHTEKQMLTELVRIVRERDPDVIEGHNIFNFDLPYLLQRAEMHNVQLALGRNDSPLRVVETRTGYADHPFEYSLVDVPGRHVIDTLLLVQSYDQGKRVLESYGLKYVAQFFGLASQDRTYIPGDRISWHWDHDAEPLTDYALDDVTETGKLSELLSGTSFYLTQMVPANFGPVSRMGAATKIESLMLREYLRRKHSVPRMRQGTQTTGGYTDVFLIGVVGPVVLADVESLYPSIMLSRKIAPASDRLGLFLNLLRDLTQARLEAKRAAQSAANQAERTRLDAMQSSLKILVNSFYGYLGYGRALFNDYAAADQVTTTGQELLRQMVDYIRSAGGKVIEVDTDGLFFMPPLSVTTEKAEKAFVDEMSRTMPEGITVVHAGRYRKMLSYKKKNYALLTYDNKLRMKGSALVSRSMERFGRTYFQRATDFLLNGDMEGLHNLYLQYHRAIVDHEMEVGDFTRVETLKDTLEEYGEQVRRGKRNKSAAYEVAIASGKPHRPGDKVAYYVTGSDANVKTFESCKLAEEWDPNFPDENTAYYLRRLDEFSQKFADFFSPQDFRAIFSADDLFPFDAKGISPLISEPLPEQPERAEDIPPARFGIWLDE